MLSHTTFSSSFRCLSVFSSPLLRVMLKVIDGTLFLKNKLGLQLHSKFKAIFYALGNEILSRNLKSVKALNYF